MSHWPLIRQRRFGPLLAIRSIAGFSTFFFKMATVVAITFVFFPDDPRQAGMVAAIAVAAGAAPSFIFASIAGEIGDRVNKAKLMQVIRGVDVVLMTAALLALISRQAAAVVAVVFLAGTRNTFTSPLTFSMLPRLLERRQLMFATGLMHAAMIVAISAGQIVAGLVSPYEAGLILLAASVTCFLLSLLIPSIPSETPDLAVNWNIFRGTAKLVRSVLSHPDLRLAVVGISLVETSGAIMLSQLPPIVRHTIGGSPGVVALFVGVAAVGTTIGGLSANRLLKGEISNRAVPRLILGMGGLTLTLWLIAVGWTFHAEQVAISSFIARPAAWIMLGLFGLIAACKGMLAVLLLAILQTAGEPGERNRYMAGNNMVNAVAVTLFTGLVGLALRIGLAPLHVLLVLGVIAVGCGVAMASTMAIREPLPT